MLRTLKIFLYDLQVYNTVLLTVVTITCIRSPELIPLIVTSLYPLINIAFPPP